MSYEGYSWIAELHSDCLPLCMQEYEAGQGWLGSSLGTGRIGEVEADVAFIIP